MGEVKEISNKPQLRGLHHSLVKKNIFISMGLVVAVIVGMEFGFKQPRKERVAEFYRNYDPMKSFERMKEAGVFDSAPPGS